MHSVGVVIHGQWSCNVQTGPACTPGRLKAQQLGPCADRYGMSPESGFRFRRCVGRPVTHVLGRLHGSGSSQVEPVVAGRALLAASGAMALIFAPLLHPGAQGWWALTVVSVVMTLVLAGSFVPDWRRLPRMSLLCFPLLVCAALSTVSLASPGFAAPLTGMLTLCFAYIGLTQPPGAAVFGLPVAAATFVCCYGVVTGPVLVRLMIAVFVWMLLAELLARLMRRQSTLTEQLAGAAHHDELTGLPNRRDLDTRLLRAAPGDAVVMCDLDNFKTVNDTLGHAAGDRVLAEFGTVLRIGVRGGDYCARFGGEEFLLLLPNTSTSQTLALLDRLRDHWATLQPSMSFSAGVAICTADRTAAESLRIADKMLYAAKAAGRNRCVAEQRPAGSAMAAT